MDNKKTCKILVAEDDKFLSRAYEFKLKKMDCDIILARDGEEAINKIKEEKPDLILLDLIMPKKSGFDVLAEAKASSETRDIPVIIMSNLGQEADVKKGLEAGAIDYVVKANTSLENVVERIQKALDGKIIIKKADSGNEPEARSAEQKTCTECSGAVSDTAKFCANCGAKL